MKLRVRFLIWTCICLPTGILFLYYLTLQTAPTKENTKQDKSDQTRRYIHETFTDMYQSRRIISATKDNEKEVRAGNDEKLQTTTDGREETSSRKSTTVPEQDTPISATEQPGRTGNDENLQTTTDGRQETSSRKSTAVSKLETTVQKAISKPNVTNVDSSETVNMSDTDVMLLKYPQFQSAEEVEFPTTTNTKPLIPHIIHQISCNESVPEPYQRFIETFTRQNFRWQYRFWTHKSGRKFLVDRYPYLVPIYDLFGKCNAKQFDMIKYAVLHEFGGVYADFDMENIRPLDKATLKYGCIIPIEPIENVAMRLRAKIFDAELRRQYDLPYVKPDVNKNIRTYQKLNVDVMLCRPKHPFLKFLLNNLKDTRNPFGDHEEVSGVDFVTKSYRIYNGTDLNISGKEVTNQTGNSSDLYKSISTMHNNDTVYIPNSQYFSDSIDPEFLDEQGNLKKCWKFDQITDLKSFEKQACTEFERRRKVRKNRKYTFIVHHWHTSKLYDYDKWLASLEKVKIRYIVPDCIIYE
ncbi:uncharacterized protein LOC123559194 [Mercenaria mercenaria]|uniref:uncharacterized protein LOC123559194 n=1 Tax=Mercenaria mercenaria TaxID=6596 RepID=UPI00234EC979|nr:uncharacterized protein LOC123559194 [Mercenaria mercenaria]